MHLNDLILGEDDFPSKLGNSHQAQNIIDYLNSLGVQIAILEDLYIDRDYMIDYQRFFCRSFENIPKVTKRLHFFSKDVSHDFKSLFENYCEESRNNLQNHYLGFVTVRPIKDINNEPLIGRTLLEPYPSLINGNHLRIENKISLFGINLVIHSAPFQAQDQGVSACATIALWTAFRSLKNLFDIPSLSPVEITEASTSYPSPGRIFPQRGLSFEQMITGIRSINLDVEVINAVPLSQIIPEIVPEIVPSIIPNDHHITTAIKAYIDMDIPLIAALSLKNDCEIIGHHAAVITGYKCDSNGKITELYVHDDQIGPYSRTLPDSDFRRWINSWTTSNQCSVLELEKLIVPIYHKIRQVFLGIYIRQLETIIRITEFLDDDIDVNLFLSSVQKYKTDLLEYNNNISNKIESSTKALPRFLWILRVTHQNQFLYDEVFDGTAIYPKSLLKVEYEL